MNRELKRIETEFEKTGLLLVTDKTAPSFATLIAGEPIKGSWWGHPKGNLIYNMLNEFLERNDVLSVKFLNLKNTLIHQSHWNALYAVANGKAPWQFKRLDQGHLNVFKKVSEKGCVRADSPAWNATAGEIGKISSRLEDKVLIYSENIHTDSGKHVRVLYSWPTIFKLRKFKPKKLSYDEALMHFELALKGVPGEESIRFPWD